nr:right-handed parallel beta-helix repeat-containing protein [Iningainema tapete]
MPSLMRDVLPIGSLLRGGAYHIDYPLGRGGFGITYRAIHLGLDKLVAIKEFYPREHVVRDSSTQSLSIPATQQEFYQRGLQRFIREGRILAKLSHRNVVQVQDLFEEQNTAFLVMELVEGRTLKDELASHPKGLPLQRVETVMEQLVEALEAVHQAGVYHLDLKPDNVLLSGNERVVLIDFGAAARQGLSSHSTRAYTETYAAPEVIAGRDIGPESDIFELGMMLHEMLTGERPLPALSRLLQDTWQPKLAQPWQRLIQAALPLGGDERPNNVRQWWQGTVVSQSPIVTKKVPNVETVIVCQKGEWHYRTITEAIQNSQPYTRILVRPGHYFEGLTINKSVEIIGDGPVEAIVIETTDQPCLIMQTDYAVVHGLTLLSHATTEIYYDSEFDEPQEFYEFLFANYQNLFNVVILQGQLLLQDCDITSVSGIGGVGIFNSTANSTIYRCKIHHGKIGIAFWGNGQGVVKECDIFNNIYSGVLLLDKSNAIIRNCQIHNNAEDNNNIGVEILDNSQGTVEECDIFSNGCGIVIEQESNATIRNCHIHKQENIGIGFGNNSQGKVIDCDIFGNSGVSVEITEGAHPTISNCQIHDGKDAGVFIHTQGQGTVVDCDIFANTLSGVVIRDGSNPTIRNCQIHDGKYAGVYVYTNGQGTVVDCDIFANAKCGVVISEGSNPIIRNCQIHDGKDAGVLFYANGQGTVANCNIFGNALSGVEFRERGNPVILECKINRNKGSAVYVHKNGAGTVENCDLTDNTNGAFYIESGCRVQRSVNKTGWFWSL